MRSTALGLALLPLLAACAGCGKEAPKARPATHAEALASVGALDCLVQKFPKDVASGQWIRFRAKFGERRGDAWLFKGFQDYYDVCMVKTTEDLSALKPDQKVVIVGRYDGFSMPKEGGSGEDSFLARRNFGAAWVWVEK